MGEYARLNKMLQEHEKTFKELQAKQDKTDEELESMIDLYVGMGEIKGALLEMADVDGLEDPYEAFYN